VMMIGVITLFIYNHVLTFALEKQLEDEETAD
jgi:hypothetical protein